MYIVYFQVNLMRSLETNLDVFLQHLNDTTDTHVGLITYSLGKSKKGKRMNEKDIREELEKMVNMYERLRKTGR